MPQSEIAENADGRETIFNMVNGMSGLLYLSGRIDLADETNLNLIKEGVRVYKTYNAEICKRYPVFPFGLKNMGETDKNALGLLSEDGSDVILSIWALSEREFEVDLSEYGFKTVKKLYGDRIEYELSGGRLKVKLAQKYSAAILKAEV